MSKEYEKTSSITWVDGQPYFELEYTCEGTVFKDAEAYEKDWDAPCYVPENAVSRETCVSLDGKEYDGEDFMDAYNDRKYHPEKWMAIPLPDTNTK